MRMKRGFVLAAVFAVVAVTAVWSNPLAGRIRVTGDSGAPLRIRVSGDGNVSLVSAAKIFHRDSVNVDVLAPAEFAIKPGSDYYVRFDASDPAATINVSANGGIRFGFGEMASRYAGISVMCGTRRGSQVHPLPVGSSVTERSCR